VRRDFARLSTEQANPRTRGLDALGVEGVVAAILREDATVARSVARERRPIVRAAKLVSDRIAGGGRMVFVGAGTSGRLGVLEAAELPPTFDTPPGLAVAVMAGGPACVWASKEGAEDDGPDGARQMRRLRIGAKDVVIGVTASGVTPFVHGALGEARRRGAGRVLVACNRAGVPKGCADVVVAAATGPEVIAGSTRLKAGTATKMMLNAITVASMVRLGKVHGNLMVDLQSRSDKLAARARRIVRTLTGAGEAEVARALSEAGGRAKTAIVMLARGEGRPAAERRLARAGGLLRKALR
jgi:N-acetylmuramic acid 6-phosphate etherase